MRTSQVLDWICRESINGEFINITTAHNENREWWKEMFGGYPSHPRPIADGTYLYYYTSQVEGYITNFFGEVEEPDYSVRVPHDDGSFEYVYLYKLEDYF